jgi:Repeat of unknown function (DUF5648)
MKKNDSVKIILLFLLTFFNSCGKLTAPIDNVLASFDDAIAKLERQSIAWQTTLKELEAQIKNDVTQIIREDLVNLVEVSIATTGVELRCNTDFFRDALIKEVKRLKNSYLKSLGMAFTEIPFTPNVCNMTPSPIKESTTSVEFFGYDLQKENIVVYLELKDGTRRDVTTNTDFNSRYKFTVLLGGSNGVPFNFNNRKIVVECKKCDNTNKFVSEVGFELPPSSLTDLHHFTNPNNGNSFYTTNAIHSDLIGWTYNSVICKVFTRQENNTVVMYRYYSSSAGLHFFTTNFTELGNGRGGYILESTPFYVYPSAINGAVPLYRYVNRSPLETHYYTIDFNLFGNGNAQWRLEGIQAYVIPK